MSPTPTPSQPSTAGARPVTTSTSPATATRRPTIPRPAGWSRSASATTICTCAHDKVGRCVELGVDLLIDDSPENLARAIEHGILTATIAHPWNRELCDEEDVICAADWRGLAAQLDPLMRRGAKLER